MGSVEDQSRGSRNLWFYCKARRGRLLRWEQRGGPNPQTKAFTVVGEVFGQRVFPAAKLGADGFPPAQGWCSRSGARKGSDRGHGAMPGDMARLSGALGPIACSAWSWHLGPDNVPE